MEIGSIFLILALLLVVGLFVGRPFIDHKKGQLISASDQADHERSALLAERDRVLTALWELDFDYTLGKIPEEDYPAQRTGLLHMGANLLRQLDALQSDHDGGDAETRLEAAIAARRMSAGAASVDTNGRTGAAVPAALLAAREDEFEVMLANRRRVRREKAAGFCPQCGQPVQQSDRFCPKCGAKTI
jgi:zinc-ribbon domain